MKVFSSQYFKNLVNAASQSHRLRAHVNVHGSCTDQCQKLFNAIHVDSYIRPHRHSFDPKDECLVAIKGLFGFVMFTEQGLIESVILFGGEKYSEKLSIPSGLELPSDVWHTVVSLLDNSILFEVKKGPFEPTLAKEFAPWAPREGDNNVTSYLEELKNECLKRLELIKKIDNWK
jgi:cupin fold WbuC family metalloprotein